VHPDLPNLSGPVLGIYAGQDNFVTPAVVHKLDQQMKALGKSFEFHIYENTDHAFFNDTRPEVYDEKASADAWRRSLKFLREHLK
jgi:carboxymethylenebutenolidase